MQSLQVDVLDLTNIEIGRENLRAVKFVDWLVKNLISFVNQPSKS